jgi:aminoglycoside phosphotransferase (APT) family kinase protein
VRRIPGGQSATTDVVRRHDDGSSLVVRRHGLWATTEDESVAHREAGALRATDAGGVPVPAVVWAGSIGARPTLVTELVPGTIVLSPPDPSAWGARLADALALIHAVLINRDLERLLTTAPAGPFDSVDPAGVLQHHDGSRLLAFRASCPPPATGSVLIHGDYHPGNVLWHDASITAVLDWEAARLGDPACDVAYCTTELQLLGLPGAAESFLATHQGRATAPLTSLPYWTATALCRSIPDLESIVASWNAHGLHVPIGEAIVRQSALISSVLGT